MQQLNIDSLWHSFELDLDKSLQVQLGSLIMVIRRENNAWSLAYSWDTDQEAAVPVCIMGDIDDFSEVRENIQRYASVSESNKLSLVPKLADRSIVARPRSPFYLVARQNLWLYVTSSVWLQIRIGDDETLLHEIPIHRLSDTWFGSNSMEGEIAYATRTHARLSLQDITLTQHRAVTPVELVNNTDNHLLLERISLPLPMLSLFSDQQHHLWTSSITMVRDNDNGSTSIKIESTAPHQVVDAKQLSAPRKVTDQNVFRKTLQVLFG